MDANAVAKDPDAFYAGYTCVNGVCWCYLNVFEYRDILDAIVLSALVESAVTPGCLLPMLLL